MAFGLTIRWRRITRGSAASRDVFLIPQISYKIRHCKFVSQGACIFIKTQKNSKRHVLFKLEQKNRRRKNLSLKRVFHKLDNNKWKVHTGARARKQKYISIYRSLHMKTFLKTGVYIYIYLLYRHERFSGKYTTRKIHKNYIWDTSGWFSIISHVSLSMT